MSRAQDAARAVRVGVVVLAGLAALLGGIWTLGQNTRAWSPKETYRVRFTNVQGLAPGSTVSLAGYRIGAVSALVLPVDITEGAVEVVLAIERENLRYVREDTRARIKTMGLLGDRYIDLTPGTPQAKELPPGSYIEAIQPPNLDAMLAQGESAVDNLVALSANLRNLTDKIARGEGVLGTLVTDTEAARQMGADARAFVTRLASVAVKLDEGDGMAGVMLNDPQAGASLRGAMTALKEASGSLQRVAGRLDAGEGLAGRLLSDPELARAVTTDLETAARNLRELAEKLNQGQGLVARLTQDRDFADRLTRDLLGLTDSLASVTRRIDAGQGSLGKLVADETLYMGVNDLLAGARKSWLTRWFISRSQKAGQGERLKRGEDGKQERGPAPVPEGAILPEPAGPELPGPVPGPGRGP